MKVPVPLGRWWETETFLLFGVSVAVLPTTLALLALWVGREIARDKQRTFTKRESIFLNLGLAMVTFLAVSGKMPMIPKLEVGWAAVTGFGIGMNGYVIFEVFQRVVLSIVNQRANTAATNLQAREVKDAKDAADAADSAAKD
jgi:hypothetical protein